MPSRFPCVKSEFWHVWCMSMSGACPCQASHGHRHFNRLEDRQFLIWEHHFWTQWRHMRGILSCLMARRTIMLKSLMACSAWFYQGRIGSACFWPTWFRLQCLVHFTPVSVRELSVLIVWGTPCFSSKVLKIHEWSWFWFHRFHVYTISSFNNKHLKEDDSFN